VIAILGATGMVGLSLARRLAERGEPLHLFARSPERLATQSWPSHVRPRSLSAFHAGEFDLVINAIGAGDPARVTVLGATLVEITDSFDRMILADMRHDTRYVFLSSGAVYGSSFAEPATATSRINLPVNDLASVPPYTLAKLCAEVRHRHLPDRAILDLRVFGFADITVPLDGRFFLAELARSVISRLPFKTSATDFIRDFAGSAEAVSLIDCWSDSGAPNGAYDLYTKAPVSKATLLDLARNRFGVDVVVSDVADSPTGLKPVYASNYHAASKLGYAPMRDACEVVRDMLERLASQS
jgi:nucleoside-diphosphate-sugar epimerase